MSTIDRSFVQQFSDNLIHLAQQRGSRLADTVMRKDIVGKYSHFDRLGKQAARLKPGRHSDTPIMDAPHSRRRVEINDYEWGELVDSEDELRMLIDPKSPYAISGGWALGRKLDEIIVDAAVGNAKSIDEDDASSNVAFDSGMIVDEDFNTADSNLIVEKLIEARRLLMAKEIDMEEELFCVVNASALASLLNETEVQSFDYNTVKALVNGEVDTFLGFKFIRTELLPDSAGGTKDVLCYAKSAIGLAMARDIQVRMAERVDKAFATQIYATMTAGATRIEEEKIVRIECTQ